MERAERFILLGLCFIAGGVSSSAFIPVSVGLPRPRARDRPWQVREGRTGCRGPDSTRVRARAPRSPKCPVEATDPESVHSGPPRGSVPPCGRTLARGQHRLSLAGVACGACAARDRRSTRRAGRADPARRHANGGRGAKARRQTGAPGVGPADRPRVRRPRTGPGGRSRPER